MKWFDAEIDKEFERMHQRLEKMLGSLSHPGAVTLCGGVLPVSGIKEKVLAAHRSGIRQVIFPQVNEKDLPDIPEPVRESMQFHLVREVPEALEVGLDSS